MTRSRAVRSIALTTVAILIGGAALLVAWEPQAVRDDPLVRMPGSQPGDGVSLEAPNRCLNCHAGYNSSVEPGFNWKGSMMAQAARDFLFFSCMTVAAQDSIWAVGNPNATDICLRCHTPTGWLGGRSDPTNASALSNDDFDGVSCDACHRQYDPFFQTTWDGSREGSDWLGYWDETNASGTPSSAAADATQAADTAEAFLARLFNGLPFFESNLPHDPGYVEATSGQYFVSSQSDKRASFADAAAKHQMLYSRFHKSKYFCSTCHDVSNPVLANLGFAGTLPGDGTTVLPTEQQPGHAFFHVERTFSEFMLSDYGLQGGAPGIGPFDPAVYDTSHPSDWISKCQDCHMRDVTGAAANKRGTPVRPGDSVEHPQSGLPLHDLTGGNAWVPWVLASAVPGSPNHDPVNESLLAAGPAALTLDLSQGQGLDPAALLAAVDRAEQQLGLAASIQNLSYDAATGDLSLRIQNQTGHKLISGFPEGRRMFLNVEVYSGGSKVWEINPYDEAAGTLKGLAATYFDPDGVLPAPAPLGPNEIQDDRLVFELHPSSSLTGENESFHFALADGRYKDNRIPPKGFRIADAADRLSVPAWMGQEDPGYFTADEYAGGYDDISLQVPTGGDAVEVRLYYQTTSREYIEFLRDEIGGTATTLSSPTPSGEPQAYVVQTDPWFGQLRAWGSTLWALWKHNMDVAGAAPIEMAEASVGTTGGGCEAPVPTLLSATPAHNQVTLVWSDEHSGNPEVIGYGVWYDQAGKAQLVTRTGLTTTYTDTGLTDGESYCYEVTSSYSESSGIGGSTESCESAFSNILCATPQPSIERLAGVASLESGYYAGKGKGAVWTVTNRFAAGDEVVFRAVVRDESGGAVEGAVVELAVSGPEGTTVTSAPSDAGGIAEAIWRTSKPKGKGGGGTPPGAYTVTTTGLTADGYTWDGVGTATSLTIQ